MKVLPTVTTENLFPDLPPMEAPKITERTIWHVGVSGGKDSAAALLWMVRESGIDPAKIRASFCDIGNDHPWTLEHVAMLSEKVHPIETIYPELNFFDLALANKRFPQPTARFCTRQLKIEPAADYIIGLRSQGFDPIAVSGVRADESDDRKNLPGWDYSGTMLCVSWRPLIRWTLLDVLAIHARHGIPMNPLYGIGAERVGCWPCMMSRKAEIRNIALRDPSRIDLIRAQEKRMWDAGNYGGFFQANICPTRFHSRTATNTKGEEFSYPTIDDVVRWSMTGDRAKGSWDDDPEKEAVTCKSGFCE